MELRPLIRRSLQHAGWNLTRYRAHEDHFRRMVRLCSDRNIKTFLDIGANTGQFAESLFAAGYRYEVVSFEPLSQAHARLRARAAGNPRWHVAERCAVGAARGTTRINIAKNSESSSILPMLPAHLAADPESAYVGSESVPLRPLDDVIDATLDRDANLALKLDVQGYEDQVLEGCVRNIRRVGLICTEMSLSPLYEGAKPFSEFFAALEAGGFRCVGIVPGFIDPKTCAMLQVDATFAAAAGEARAPSRAAMASRERNPPGRAVVLAAEGKEI